MGGMMSPVRLYAFGTLLAVGVTVVANVLAPGSVTTIAATFAILVPLATILIVDRMTAMRDAYESRQEILTAIGDAGRTSGQVISLGSDEAWVRYVERNASGARAILNTRLSEFTGMYDEFHDRVDDAIAKAVQSGTDYDFVCSTTRLASLEALRARISEGENVGRLRVYPLATGGKPLLQMKIFDYGEYSEAMLGFVARSERDRTQPIFLVRNQELVEYLRHVFLSYCDESRAQSS